MAFPFLILSLLFGLDSTTHAESWPQFRGPSFNGQVGSDFPESWSSTQNVVWTTEIEGEGWSCPVVWQDRVFVTAAVSETQTIGDGDETAQPRRGRRQRADLTKQKYRWEVICLDAKSGDILWKKIAKTGSPRMGRHRDNSYATETPVTDGEHVYAYFGMTGLFCFDIAGELKWEKDLGNFKMRADWGTASSPLLYEDKLILQIDNEDQSFLVALDKTNGEQIWRVDRDEPSQYSSPIIWRNSQRNELIAGGQFCRSYDPNTGQLLWELDMEKGRSSATPLAVGDRLYVGTELRNRGGPDDGGGFLFAIKPGGSGNISPSEGALQSKFVAWKTAKAGIQMASPVICNDHLYLFERRSGTLHCVDAQSGDIVYRKRVPGARAFWASPWVKDNKVFCLDDNGTTHVIAGGSTFRVIGKNVIDQRAWSTPAFAQSSLFLRTANQVYCIADSDNR